MADWNRAESGRINKIRAKSAPALAEVEKLAGHISSVDPEHFGRLTSVLGIAID